VTAANIFGLDQHDAHIAGEASTKGRPGDPAADNQDIHFIHRGRGYGLERRGV
jgi:hypothetical protein